MLEKGKITAGEFRILVILFIVGSSILVTPALLVKLAKQDAWMTTILTLIISVSFVFLYNRVALLYPSLTFVESNEKILGKWVGKITSLLFLFYFFHLSSTSIREIGDFITTQVLVETPIEMIMIIFLFTSLIGVRLGLEVICRTALIFLPWTAALLVMLLLFLLPEIEFINIQPIWGEGMKPIIKGSYSNLGLPYLELAIFLMITPYVNEKGKMKKAFFSGTLIGGFVLILLVTFSILVLGPDLTARHTYPSYILGKKISIGEFLERIEVIVAIMWFFTMYFKLTICYYGLALGLAQVCGLKNYQILLFPLAFLMVSFARFSHPDIVHFENFIAKTWTPYSLTICLFLPLLVFVIGTVRKRRSTAKAAKPF